MKTHTLPVALNDAELEEFGREMDAIREDTLDALGEKDRHYILRVIKLHRSMDFLSRMIIFAGLFFHPLWQHAWAGQTVMLTLFGIGTLMLGMAKILENMELGHNILHAQWDWMKDPSIHSSTWEWDNTCPSDTWMKSHNIVHHTWTNVVGKDLDVGYGVLRVTPLQKWHPAYLLQMVYVFAIMLLFEWAVAVHDDHIDELMRGKRTFRQTASVFANIGRKMWRQARKDYLAWPLVGLLVAIPINLAGSLPVLGPTPDILPQVFLYVLLANIVANLIRNIWTFVIIFCGHFPEGSYNFTEAQVEDETRARWYIRQLLGSCNIKGGKTFDLFAGNLSYQIEHHLFPDLPSSRYPEISRRVQAQCARYGLPYNKGSLTRQFGTTLIRLTRMSFPGGSTEQKIAQA
ncbi:MAG: acyl-CoA desaturase [Pseudomonadota bacterium]